MKTRRLTRRQLVIVAAVLFFLFTLLLTSGSRNKYHEEQAGGGPIKNRPWRPWGHGSAPCTDDLGWLEPYKLSSRFRFAQRDIIAVPSGSPDRPPVSVVDKPLFEFSKVDIALSTKAETRCLEPLKLGVSRVKPPVVDASHLIFGAQTTTKRLKDTVKHIARWLPHTGARLHVIVKDDEETPANDKEMRALENKFRDQGMDVFIVHPVKLSDFFAQRYFSLVNVLYGARNEKTKWVILIDDDTFFPSMRDLVAFLAKYDASQQQYIGALSEDWWAVDHYGLMGFGGAGIFLSLPLAKVIDDNTADCKTHPSTSSGDVTVMDCIYRHSTTKLTHVPALRQVDIPGDTTGLYESGREMLTLHHWKNAPHQLEMEKLHLVADICDNCFLQRWQFSDDTVLTNGFSINYYPEGHLTGKTQGSSLLGSLKGPQKIDLMKMEKTWDGDMKVFHSLGPVREPLNETAKVGYKLIDSMLVDNEPEAGKNEEKCTMVRQVYYKKGGEEDMDSVIVLNWMTDHQKSRGDEENPQ